MSFNFGSQEYAGTFQNLPIPNVPSLRSSTLEYLDKFDPQTWYDEPITSILKGVKLEGTPENLVTTKDGLGNDNGKQYYATSEQVEALMDHIRTFKSTATDLREPLRRVEEQLLGEYAGFLIGNQCLDFGKQDGITEMEEATMANAVERKLNDLLLRDESNGVLSIQRKPIYVSCVSNFTNFLDLFRKTIRNLEVGVPCVVLGRTNTVQHSYRWTQLLVDLCVQEGVDPGMITYLSCSLEDIKRITRSCSEYTGNLYATCSRQLAADIMSGYPNTIASTGGPNTLVSTEWTPSVVEAIQMSATIESSGQCTALRHAVVPPSVDHGQLQSVFDSVKAIPSAKDALSNAVFDGVFAKHTGTQEPSSYKCHDKADAFYKIGEELPAGPIDEFWRKVVVDFSTLDASDPKRVGELSSWLNQNQPISLAVNVPRANGFDLALSLFEKTGLVVYTVGSTDGNTALTCQARPQEGEIFGEFPPRDQFGSISKFPVVVPSSTPSYDAHYTEEYLKSCVPPDTFHDADTLALIDEVSDELVRGYCHALLNYLVDATFENPKRGFGKSRTALFGLQRTPLGTKTMIRCDAVKTSINDIAPVLLLFYATNARKDICVSVDPKNKSLIALCEKYKIPLSVDDDVENLYQVVKVETPFQEFFMAGQFVSLYLPVGHIKSTMADDDEFLSAFKKSEKWLRLVE